MNRHSSIREERVRRAITAAGLLVVLACVVVIYLAMPKKHHEEKRVTSQVAVVATQHGASVQKNPAGSVAQLPSRPSPAMQAGQAMNGGVQSHADRSQESLRILLAHYDRLVEAETNPVRRANLKSLRAALELPLLIGEANEQSQQSHRPGQTSLGQMQLDHERAHGAREEGRQLTGTINRALEQIFSATPLPSPPSGIKK